MEIEMMILTNFENFTSGRNALASPRNEFVKFTRRAAAMREPLHCRKPTETLTPIAEKTCLFACQMDFHFCSGLNMPLHTHTHTHTQSPTLGMRANEFMFLVF